GPDADAHEVAVPVVGQRHHVVGHRATRALECLGQLGGVEEPAEQRLAVAASIDCTVSSGMGSNWSLSGAMPSANRCASRSTNAMCPNPTLQTGRRKGRS